MGFNPEKFGQTNHKLWFTQRTTLDDAYYSPPHSEVDDERNEKRPLKHMLKESWSHNYSNERPWQKEGGFSAISHGLLLIV